MRVARGFRPTFAALTAAATLVAYTGLSVPVRPAQAADAETAALLELLDDLEDFVPSLAAVGALGRTIPNLGLEPGSADGVGLATLMTQTRSLVLDPELSAAADVGDLIDAIHDASGDLGDGRTVTFTATESIAGAIAVGMTVTRQVETSLDILGDEPIGPGYPPFSLTSDDGVEVDLELTASFVMNYVPDGGGPAWLSAPSLSLTADAGFEQPVDIDGGVGILGIKLGPDSVLDLSATLTAAFQDPNNDGRLYFDEPGGTTTEDGELSAAGAGAGLVTVGLSDGSVTATLDIEAAESTAIDLPAVTAQVTVTGDLDAGTIDVDFASGAFDSVRGFLNLSTRDLAQGLASAATSVLALQNATGVELPFMRGDYANAVGAVQAITDYLESHVPEADPDSLTPGLPTFTSLQQLLEQLEDPAEIPGDNLVDITGASYDAATTKVRFTMSITRAASAGSVDLNPAPQPLSGANASYEATTLTDDDGKLFSADLIGRQVMAGTSSGIIAAVSGSTLTLDPAPVTSDQNPSPTNFWVGGTPSDDSGYSIAAGDAKIGAVELGNALEDDTSGAITNANAKFAQAQVTPSFTLNLPIVLDLADPDTTNCNPDGAPEPCPYEHEANGITQIIESLPLTADRVMLDVDGFSLTGDADITTGVDVDATVGFLGVKVEGTLKACTVSAGVNEECVGSKAVDDHLLSLGLKPLSGADAEGDIAFSRLVEALTAALKSNTPTDVLDVQVAGQAYANLTVEVPGAPQFFGGSSPTASVEIVLPDITDPDTFDVTPGSSIGDLGSFNLDTDNPLALFGALLADLQALQGVIGDFPGSGALDTEIPLVGKSLNEVIGAGASGSGAPVTYTAVAGPPAMTTLEDTGKTFDASYVGRTVRVGSQEARVSAFDPTKPSELVLKPALAPLPAAGAAYTTDSELQGLIDTLQDTSSNNLQEMLGTLAEKLGAGSAATFEVLPGTTDTLKIKLHWVREYVNQAPMDLKFQFPSGTDRSLIGAQGTGLVTTTASGEIDVSLLIPLDATTLADPAAALLIDPTESSVKAGISVDSDDVDLAANLGPFEATVTDGVLKAGLGVDLSGTGTDPQSLTDFVTGVAVAVTGDGAECDGDGIDSSTELALCAVLPLKVNGVDAGTAPETSNFIVRLPLDTGDLADTLNPLGDPVDGKSRVEVPDALGNTLAQAALSLLSFGDGFTGYLEFTERALRTASFDGKLPLVGKDLQVGADFIGGVRAELDTVFAGPVPTDTTAGAIRTFAQGALNDALPTAGGALDVDVTCLTPLAAAGAPSVTKTGTSTAATYRYKIVAVTKVSGVDKPTVTGPASPLRANVAVADMNADNKFDLSWGDVDRATSYYVLRSVDGGDYHRIGHTTATEFTDQGADADAEPWVDVPANEAPCPDSTPAEEVTGFSITVSLGQGNPSAAGCATDATLPDGQKECLTNTIPLDLGIPGLSLKATDQTTGIDASVGWRLDLKLVFDRTAGFYVDTQESGSPEFRVGASVSLPEQLQAQLAFLNITATDNDTAAPEFAGLFTIDLTDGDGQLALDQIISPDVADFVAVSLSGGVDVDVHLAAGADSALPGIETDFLLTWQWTSAAPSDIDTLSIAFNNVSLNAGEFLDGVIGPIVDMVVDVFKPVQPVIDTLFEKIPVLSDLSEMVGGDPITIASLADTFSTLAGGPDLEPFLDVLKNIRDLVKALDNTSGACATACLTVGSFSLVAPKAISTDVNPATADGLIDKTTGYSKNDNLLSDVNDESPAEIDKSGSDVDHPGFSFPFLEKPEMIFGLIVGQDVDLVKFDSGPLTLGFEFQQSFGPVYAPPPVNIVVGGGASVTLRIVAGFDTYGIRTAIERGKFDAGVLDSLFFYTTDEAGKPIPVVQFEGYLQAGASVSLVVIEVGVVGGVKLTISFFWNDPNNDGKFRFSEFLAAALNNPICLFNVGGELSLFIKVFVTLGISPFSTSFDFTLVDVVLLEFNLKPDCTPPPPNLGGVSGDTLYLFAGNFGSTAQRAAGYSGDYPFDNDGGTAEEKWVIRQHAAKPAVPAQPAVADPDGPGPLKEQLAQPAQSAEPAKITVTALGITEDFPDPDGTTIQNVVLDGAGTTGKLQVTFNGGDKDTPFSKNVVVTTGSGNDVIRTGIGSAVVDSGGGADQITTLERTDLSLDPATAPTALVSGGAGADVITVGNGRNTVLGDKPLTFTEQESLDLVKADGTTVAVSGLHSAAGASLPADPDEDATDGDADQIAAGLGGSTIYGNNGGDKIGTANDNPQAGLGKPNPEYYLAAANRIVGGSGDDRIKSGSASDVIFTGFEDEITQDEEGTGDTAATKNSVDTGEGSDTVYGSNGQDFVTTHSVIKDGVPQTATVFGGGESDVLIGGAGTDKLYGGRDDDHLIAGPATVGSAPAVTDQLSALSGGLAYQVELEPLPEPVSAKLLVGGGGKDRIYGVDGPATIFGDHEGVDCVRQSDPVSKQPTESPVVFPAPGADRDDHDLILGGEGVDTVNAGGGNDHVELYGSGDTACGSGGDDTIFGGNAEDLVYGGSGNDKLYGDNDPDEVFGNDGNDSVFGGLGTDELQGNAGSDFVTGGQGDDLVIGGTSKAGEPDAGDQVYGDEGEDTVIGDNADSPSIPSYPADLEDGSATPTTGGDDYVYGGAANDLAYGGLRDDYVYGGGGDDDLEGNNASDRVFGEAGTDNVIGGSSQSGGDDAADNEVGRPDGADFLYGGGGDDVLTGDNARVSRTGTFTPITVTRSGVTPREITLLDLGYLTDSTKSGADQLFGGIENDVLLGQGAHDEVWGEDGDDYAEGGQADDIVRGGDGQDDLIGGSHVVQSGAGQARAGQHDSGDTVYGGTGADVVLGDNGQVLRGTGVNSDITKNRGAMLERLVEIYDLGNTPVEGTSGGDWLLGEDAADVILGQDGTDRINGGDDEDFAEGGPGKDWVEGNAGDDDLLGGSSTTLGANTGDTTVGQPDAADVVWGGSGDDLILGDNAIVSRVGEMHELTYRIGTNPAAEITDRRALQLLDLNGGNTLVEPAGRSGGDHLSGQGGVDVILGQDGGDAISGGSADDYVEGQGAGDSIFGDVPLVDVPTTPTELTVWPGAPTLGYAADGGADGQDDLIGGKSEAAFRDGDDTIHGNGESDFALGDNGTAVREILGEPGSLTDRAYTLRYPAATLPANAAKIRVADSDFPSTRFCDATLEQCERGGAFGGDSIYGDGGDDFLYGQDGNDAVWGGTEDDDIYGELGNDTLFGEAGDDAILGDRGGIRDRYETGDDTFNLSVTQVPKVSYEGFSPGSVTRIVDLLHDVNGDVFVGSSADGDDPMPHNGRDFGGDDRIRGGLDDDSIHAGWGDDLANGDSGGDIVFGDDGADVLWGGKGCDAEADTISTKPECFTADGSFDPAPHRADGSTVPSVTDYLLGGKGGTSAESLEGANGSDILDWRPRGSYDPGSGCTTDDWPVDLAPVGKKGVSATIDPCSWFEMTDIHDADDTNNQHHQGIDWQYGGWDRDVLQGDVADNGPNEGDRLLDWDGAYNLYTHCNAAYGGFNDVRQHSPTWQDFLQRMVYGLGAGQAASDATTDGTSAFVELALVYPGVDREHGSGKAYPATPGHFDNPNACAE